MEVIFGILGILLFFFLLIYLKAGISKLTNTTFVDRSRRPTVTPDMFDNINEMIKEGAVNSIQSLKTSIKGNINNLQKSNSSSYEYVIAHPKNSIGKIKISDNLDKIIETFGKDYIVKEHGTKEKGVYSREYIYTALGYSFLIKASDVLQKIWYIKAFPPLKVQTKYGIKLLDSSLKDVIEIYGKPQIKRTSDENVYSAEYDGIEFCFNKINGTEFFPFNKELHLNKKIIEIIIKDN